MALSADEYRRAWEQQDAAPFRFNRRIVPGTCVLETLAMVKSVGLRYVFVDDFGYAVSYCRQRLCEDLVPPEMRGGAEGPGEWLRMRAAFTAADLDRSWAVADATFALLLDAFITQGYSRALSERLRVVVNDYGLDLELGEIYLLPQDIASLLGQTGNPFVWWDDDVSRPEQEHQTFRFADARHRAILARRLREVNEAG